MIPQRCLLAHFEATFATNKIECSFEITSLGVPFILLLMVQSFIKYNTRDVYFYIYSVSAYMGLPVLWIPL